MSDSQLFLAADGTIRQLCLPFGMEEMVRDWSSLVPLMARRKPDAFTRMEWAYLMTFLSGDSLRQPFLEEFGTPVGRDRTPRSCLRPRGQVALWLPNNVSLLGPLVAVLVSLSGNPLRAKVGSRGTDLLGVFLAFCRDRAPDGPLRQWLDEGVETSRFDRADPRNLEMAASARVRIVFGSDQAAREVETLPHPTGSLGFYFTDRVSEAWVQAQALTDEAVATLARVFAVYGRKGCTSPARVVVLGGEAGDAAGLRDRLAAAWPQAVRAQPARSVASQCILAWQAARAQGWDAVLAPGHGAVFAWGGRELAAVEGTMILPVTWASTHEAVGDLPGNIQTIGHVLEDPGRPIWQTTIGQTGVKRFVPLAEMHHFSHVWDGIPFWRELFEEVGG